MTYLTYQIYHILILLLIEPLTVQQRHNNIKASRSLRVSRGVANGMWGGAYNIYLKLNIQHILYIDIGVQWAVGETGD